MTSNDETTADEPQRIDLTQFEGMSEGKWEHDGGAIYAEEAERNNPIIAEYPSWNYNVKDNDGLLTVEDHCNLIAMAAVPDLIAELKRCYEREDEAKAIREYIKMYIGEMSAEELLEDILTGAYIDEPEVWKASE